MIGVVGLSHQTAPIAVREQLALSREQAVELLHAAVASPAIGEALLVSTCNRVELVTAGDELEAVARESVGVIARIAPGIEKHLYVHTGAAAVRHLFRVACSLDSLVLGEPQILGQVKDAFEVARAAGTVGPRLHRTLPRAIRAAKRVRTETSIGTGQVSVPSVAVDLTRQIFGDLARRTVALIGSGDMAETVAKLLRNAGSRLFVVGRNAQRAAELATAVGGSPRPWSELSAALLDADVVITSTSAPHHVVDYDMVHGLRRKRRGRSLFFIDLAVPRDVDPRVEKVEGVFLYNIDDFSRVVAQSHSARRREAEAAEAIVDQEVAGFERWAEATRVNPTLIALRNRMRAVLLTELEKSLRTKLKGVGHEERLALDRMLEAALNKLLHAPSTRLREIAGDREFESYRAEELAAALVELFALDAELEPDEELAADADPASGPQRAGSGGR